MVTLQYREEHTSSKFKEIVDLYKIKAEQKKQENLVLFLEYDAVILTHLSDTLPHYYYVCSQNKTNTRVFNAIMDLLNEAMKETLSQLGYTGNNFFDFSV